MVKSILYKYGKRTLHFFAVYSAYECYIRQTYTDFSS